ncbi:fatty acyl-CoA reductase wat-like [Daktulosphaira vitifoliae]|uniref:fatty acyl-CoA reductase wat-like n=1 Tax=Daktulosphaira vitifoliae TaxID=58002 RepID=UPI0021AACF9C|nr:fatty acyl-CoA reductase wat-like [Daktulosphaira vitifoliae]
MKSNIVDTFNSNTILITGSTGFLGKLLMEKLLRTCPGITNIVVIIRSKKNSSADNRALETYEGTVFDRLRKENPDFMRKIKVFNGDLQSPLLNLSQNNLEWIVNNVNFIFHCAATLKFDEHIKKATQINVEGTERLLNIATQMKNLKGFIHVSTAYSHCPRQEIDEEFYPIEITTEDLKLHVKNSNEEIEIQKFWPNTYTFTKAMAENLVETYGKRLPVGIFRPSIVGSTFKEPIPGYLENMNGPSGVVAGTIVGFLRAIPCKLNNVVDIVPADYTVNALIASMWDTANRYQNSVSDKPKIYNYVSSTVSPLTWERYMSESKQIFYTAPPNCAIWYGIIYTYDNKWLGKFLWLFLHWIPGIIFDCMLLLVGKSTRFYKMYTKANKMMNVLRPFTLSQWKFKNKNTQKIWSLLSEEEQKIFFFNMEHFDWSSYIQTYYFGIRNYILHENKQNISDALKKHKRLYYLHMFTLFLLTYVFYFLVSTSFGLNFFGF